MHKTVQDNGAIIVVDFYTEPYQLFVTSLLGVSRTGLMIGLPQVVRTIFLVILDTDDSKITPELSLSNPISI